MASSVCESPLRRFAAKDLPSKGNSPVELNRLKSLLRKNAVGENGNAVSSPKKTETPRKEVKVKRGATVKLCSSCEEHNKDVRESIGPNVDSKQSKATQEDTEAAKKKRVTRKDAANAEGQGQTLNSADAAKAVEKKTAAKKPRETKKKTAVTQYEKLDVPSTSGNAQSDTEANALTDGGAQPEAESKPKRQRKKVDKTAQQDEADSLPGKATEPKRKKKDEADSSTGKGDKPKSKKKNIIKVKIPLPKKTTKVPPEDNAKALFENMNDTDLVNSTQQGKQSAIQDAIEDDDGAAKSKPTKTDKDREVIFEESVTPDSTLTNMETSNDLAGPSIVKATTSKSKSKTKDATKTKIPRPKKTNKHLPEDNETVPFENMNVTDLINSTQLGEENAENSCRGAKPKLQKPSKALTVTFSKSDSAGSLTVNEKASKSKPKASKVKSSCPKKTAKQLPEDNETAPFENMDVTDLVNSTQIGEDSAQTSVGNTQNKSAKTAKALTNNNTSTQKNKSHDSGVIGDSEDMFKDDSLTDMQKKMQAMNFSGSDMSAPKDTSNLEHSSGNVFCTPANNSHHSMDIMMTPACDKDDFDDGILHFSFSNNSHKVLTDENTETSAGININLSTSTNISHNGPIEIDPMDLSSANNSAAHHPDIHNDETFYNQDLSNNTVDNMIDANVTLRTRLARKKAANASKNATSDGISSFIQNDANKNTTRKVFRKNDKNLQQPSTDDIGHLMQIKSELPDYANSSLSQSISKDQSSISIKKPQKQASKSTGMKAKKTKYSAETSKVSEESTEKTTKKSKKDSATESPQKEAECSKKKSKSRKNDETLCEKHKNCKRSDEKVCHRLAKETKANKQLKSDMKVAKAMEAMSKHFSRISIGTTIGTINELHIGKLPSQSDSSDECSTDCSCEDYTDDSNSSGDKCKCWKCLLDQNDSSDDCECSESSDEEGDDDEEESSDKSNSSESNSSDGSSSSSSSPEKIRHPAAKKCSAKATKTDKPTYKEKLSRFCSRYDLRCNSSRYALRSKES